MAYISTNCPLYALTIGRICGHPTSTAAEDMLTRTSSEGTRRHHDPCLAQEITDILLPLNLTGYHWIFAHARSSSNGQRSITIHDSLDMVSGLRPSHTTQICYFLEVLGHYHPAFQGSWPSTLSYGRTIRQVTDDCGPFTVWGMRRIWTGKNRLYSSEDPVKLGERIRLTGMREIFHILANSPVETSMHLQSDMIQLAETEVPNYASLDYASHTENLSKLECFATILLHPQPIYRKEDVDRRINYSLYVLRARAVGMHVPGERKNESSLKCRLSNRIYDKAGFLSEPPHIPQAAHLLFSDDRHRLSLANDIETRFDLVIVISNASNVHTCQLLYTMWRDTFDNVPCRVSIGDVNTAHTPHGTLEHPAWVSLDLDVPLDTNTRGQPQKHEGESLHTLLGSLHGLHPKRVLFLQHGVYSLTSSNATWGHMNQRYPDIDFHLTTLMLEAHDESLFPSSV
jgi:hypothetical protein